MSDLLRFERRVYSQNGEDGILAELAHRAKLHDREQRSCVELGCDFRFGNCYLLAEQQWHTLFVDCCADAVSCLLRKFAGPRISYKVAAVTAENVNDIVSPAIDLLSLDIDGNDYWVWQALKARPTLVVVEFNPKHPPPLQRVIRYEPEFRWQGDDYFGASLSAFCALGVRKGYRFVGTDSSINAYFVRDDLDVGLAVAEPADCYVSPWRPHLVSDRAMIEP